MKASTLHQIYQAIGQRMEEIETKRGVNRGGVSDGIMCMSDPLALEYQRLDRIQRHVGCHWFAARDREECPRTMGNARCHYRRPTNDRPT